MPTGWDHAAALERLDGDELLLVELISVFFEEYPKLAARLTQSLSLKDFAGLRVGTRAPISGYRWSEGRCVSSS